MSSDAATDAVTGPKVFISYRRSDTEDVAERLSSLLKSDLGSRNVYRDRESMILGQPWRQALRTAMHDADAALFLVGPDWEGASTDGRRIDDEDDPVLSEVVEALRPGMRANPLPLLVDRTEPPHDLPSNAGELFDEVHFVSLNRDGITSETGKEYQAILVGIWAALARLVPHGVIILGESSKMVELDSLVEELTESGSLDARTLSRFASGVYIASWRDVKKIESDFPQLIVQSSGEPSDELKARLAAFATLSTGATVAVTGVGAVALVAMGPSLGLGGSTGAGTLMEASIPQLIATTTNVSTGSSAGISGLWTSTGPGAKIAAAAAGVAIAAGGVLLVANAGDDSGSALDESEASSSDVQWADGVPTMQLSNAVEDPRRNPRNLVGPPDWEGSEDFDDPDSYMSIGDAVEDCEFFVVVEFTDNRLVDREGPDLRIVELGPPAEPLDVFAVTPDGSEEPLVEVNFTEVSSSSYDYEFDLAGNVGDTEIAQVKLCDRPGDETGRPWPGPDIDAVEAIHSVDS